MPSPSAKSAGCTTYARPVSRPFRSVRASSTCCWPATCACDVLEHVEDDGGALTELRRVASAGGMLLITVPAYQWMWTEHDVQLHHFRRYTLRNLRFRVRDAGWDLVRATYFNSMALPLVAAARLAERPSSRRGHTDLDRTPAILNGVLELPMKLEAIMIGHGARLPAGVSLGMLCRNPG